jgi:hypothetical protein
MGLSVGRSDLHPLVEGWTEGEAVEDEIVASGFRLRRAGRCAVDREGLEVNGAAAELAGGADPLPRARFELLERVATIDALQARRVSYETRSLDGHRVGWASVDEVFAESDAPSSYRHARSNGVALHLDFARATARAVAELTERDRVLRAWLGETRPEPIPLTGFAAVLRDATDHVFRAVRFPPSPRPSFGASLHVAGVFGFPWSRSAPLVLGYAARTSLEDALEAAARESLQQLAFLSGETIPTEPPEIGPSALHHLEHWLYPGHHSVLVAWLDDGHAAFRPRGSLPNTAAAPRIVDLTPPAFGLRLSVVKAISPGAIPLVFGAWPFARELPPELRVHPIL